MIQEIITYTIVFSTIIYAFYSILKIFFKKESKSCTSCSSGSCEGCSLKTDLAEKLKFNYKVNKGIEV